MKKGSRAERRARVISVLNEARAMELHAIHQYMNQHYNLDNMDYGELAAKVKLIAIDEMRHAEIFVSVCKDNGDSTSAQILETIIDEEQLHFNYFDNIATHIDKLGAAYLATVAGTPSATGLQPSGFVISQKA
jgi:bacterioferritin